MLVKSSSTLSGNGTAFDWSRAESEVRGLADVASAVGEAGLAAGSGLPVAQWRELSTPTLVALAQAGHREAFDPLYQRYASRVLSFARSRCGADRALADDVAAEAWVAAMIRINTWQVRGRDDDDLVRWLFGLVRRVVAETMEARCRQVPGGHIEYWDWLDIPEPPSDDEWVGCPDKPQLAGRLNVEIDRLSPRCRAVVRMRLDGADYTEIARTVGLTGEQVRGAWRRAQVELRRRLVGRIDVDTLSDTDRDRLCELAAELPPAARQVALLRLAGTPIPQVAKSLAITGTQAHNIWRHAEDLLRQLLDDPGLARRPAGGRQAAWLPERARLRQAAELLSPARRRVALLRLEGLTHPEIAARLGCPEGTVNAAWSAALNQFQHAGLITA